jgi:hypothetical protein
MITPYRLTYFLEDEPALVKKVYDSHLRQEQITEMFSLLHEYNELKMKKSK